MDDEDHAFLSEIKGTLAWKKFVTILGNPRIRAVVQSEVKSKLDKTKREETDLLVAWSLHNKLTYTSESAKELGELEVEGFLRGLKRGKKIGDNLWKGKDSLQKQIDDFQQVWFEFDREIDRDIRDPKVLAAVFSQHLPAVKRSLSDVRNNTAILFYLIKKHEAEVGRSKNE